MCCRRRFVIETSDYVTALIMVPAAAQIAARVTDITLQFHSRGEVGEISLDAGLADLTVTPEIFAAPEHETEHLSTDDIVLVGDRDKAALLAPPTPNAFFELGHVAVVFGRRRTASFADMTLPRDGPARRVALVKQYGRYGCRRAPPSGAVRAVR